MNMIINTDKVFSYFEDCIGELNIENVKEDDVTLAVMIKGAITFANDFYMLSDEDDCILKRKVNTYLEKIESK